MRKQILKLSLLLAIILAANNIFGQSLKVGPGGGLNIIQAPELFTDGTNGLGFGSEYFLGGNAEIELPLIPLTIYGSIYYTNLQSKVNETEIEGSLLSSSLGGKYNIMPGPISLYLAGQISFTSFGEIENSPNGPIKKDSFTGLSLGGGLKITLLPKIDVDISALYNYVNLFGKDPGEPTIKSFSLGANFLFTVL